MSLSQRIKDLREERAKLAAQAGEILTLAKKEDRAVSKDDEERFDKIHKDIEAKGAEVELLERQLVVEHELATTRESVGRAQLRGGSREEDADDDSVRRGFRTWESRTRHLDAVESCVHSFLTGSDIAEGHRSVLLPARVKRGAAIEFHVPYALSPSGLARMLADFQLRAEQRALSAAVGSAGGFTVPEGFLPELIEAQLQFGPIRSAARVLQTSGGEDLPLPTVDDTSSEGELLGESQEVNEQDVTFGEIRLKAYKYSSKGIRVPFELEQDSFFDVGGFVGRISGQRLARITTRHFTTGDGVNKPSGLVTESFQGHVAALANAISRDDFLELKHSVDPAYRTDPRYMWNDATLLLIKKLVDADGRPLWQPGVGVGVPDRFDGDLYLLNQQMPDVGTGNRSVVYGALSNFVIRDVGSIRLLVLDQRYGEFDQTGYFAFQRADSKLLDAGTHPVKHLVHP